ncbi:MAG TPA: hypothetical protein VMU67_15925 [Steroidobacteraceae bacterium]|nr:hypothetical protein [Steroidobacteraceae bacterium]
MNTGRFATPGKTRTCPHCKATILESAAVCPGCHHHLRFDPAAAGQRTPALTPLRVEGKLSPPADGAPWEYSVVLAIRNARGEEVARQVVGVGALQPSEERTFSLAVEVFIPAELTETKPAVPAVAPPRVGDPRAPVPSKLGPPPPLPPPPAPRDPRMPPRPTALKDPRLFARDHKTTPKGN